MNNNSARFRSGGTSFFTFAPIRMGAIEEVTVSTAGLTADAGAEGAVQIQFVTKRGTNAFRGQVFDQIQNDKLNANSVVNAARACPKTKLRQHEWGANAGGPIIRNKLFFFANYEQIYSPSESTRSGTVLTAEAQQGVFRYSAADNCERTVNLLDIARANGLPSSIDPFVATQFQAVNSALGQGNVAEPDAPAQNTYPVHQPAAAERRTSTPQRASTIRPRRASPMRGVLNLQWRDLPTQPAVPRAAAMNDGFTSTYYILSTGADWTLQPEPLLSDELRRAEQLRRVRPGQHARHLRSPQGGQPRSTLPMMDPATAIMTSPQPTKT